MVTRTSRTTIAASLPHCSCSDPILRYIDGLELRQAVDKQLNKVELANKLTRAVAVGKVTAKAVDPKTNGFPADNDTPLGKQVFHIRCAQGKPVIDPHCVGDNFPRKTKPLQTGKGAR
ncbi:Tn3 family transposase [Rhizobium leguminosarum]|nr:Tn3 family transposase [Rhizobium leguminosarum]